MHMIKKVDDKKGNIFVLLEKCWISNKYKKKDEMFRIYYTGK